MPRLYHDEILTVSLPEPWALLPTKRPDLVSFEEPRRRLSVSIVRFEHEPQDIRDAVTKLHDLRLALERKALSPNDPFTVQPLEAVGSRLTAFFSGGERKTGRIFSGVVTGGNEAVVIAYFESLDGDYRGHLATMTDIVFPGLAFRVGSAP